MFKCAITGEAVTGRSPARVILEVRPVRYKILLQTNERIVKEALGWEIVREALVDPLIVHKVPTLEQLLEQVKSKEPVLRVEYLKRRPKRIWVPRSNKSKGMSPTSRLKIVKR